MVYVFLVPFDTLSFVVFIRIVGLLEIIESKKTLKNSFEGGNLLWP